MSPFPRGAAVRSDAGLWGFERALARHGFTPVAGADEAGRGACAGPLVVAAVMLPEGRRGLVPGLADSKLLTPAARERVYAEVMDRALAHHVVVIPPQEVDRVGLHVSNVRGMRRAVAGLRPSAAYVLTDGFRVPGLTAPGLAIWKGDRVAACIAAASVLAKVTRDRMMVALHESFPAYDFATHKGYITPTHQAALLTHGPCPEHRFSFVNVRSRLQTLDLGDNVSVDVRMSVGLDLGVDLGPDVGLAGCPGTDLAGYPGTDLAEGLEPVMGA